MSKILNHENHWFQEVAPRDYYLENDLERAVMMYLENIFPEFIAFPFKQDLLNVYASRSNAADLGMLKRDYSEWYIIEVELGKHSLNDVILQIETFTYFKRDNSHSKYIYDNTVGLDLARIDHMVQNIEPKTMVIVNEIRKDWKAELDGLGCALCVFQVYDDPTARRMYRIDGEHPFIFTDFCNCKYEKGTGFVIRLLRNDFLDGYGIENGKILNISYNGKLTPWKRMDSGKTTYLISESKYSPLDPLTGRYRLNFQRKNQDSPIVGTFTFTKD